MHPPIHLQKKKKRKSLEIHIPDKGFTYRIYKEISELINKKTILKGQTT